MLKPRPPSYVGSGAHLSTDGDWAGETDGEAAALAVPGVPSQGWRRCCENHSRPLLPAILITQPAPSLGSSSTSRDVLLRLVQRAAMPPRSQAIETGPERQRTGPLSVRRGIQKATPTATSPASTRPSLAEDPVRPLPHRLIAFGGGGGHAVRPREAHAAIAQAEWGADIQGRQPRNFGLLLPLARISWPEERRPERVAALPPRCSAIALSDPASSAFGRLLCLVRGSQPSASSHKAATRVSPDAPSYKSEVMVSSQT